MPPPAAARGREQRAWACPPQTQTPPGDEDYTTTSDGDVEAGQLFGNMKTQLRWSPDDGALHLNVRQLVETTRGVELKVGPCTRLGRVRCPGAVPSADAERDSSAWRQMHGVGLRPAALHGDAGCSKSRRWMTIKQLWRDTRADEQLCRTRINSCPPPAAARSTRAA